MYRFALRAVAAINEVRGQIRPCAIGLIACVNMRTLMKSRGPCPQCNKSGGGSLPPLPPCSYPSDIADSAELKKHGNETQGCLASCHLLVNMIVCALKCEGSRIRLWLIAEHHFGSVYNTVALQNQFVMTPSLAMPHMCQGFCTLVLSFFYWLQ